MTLHICVFVLSFPLGDSDSLHQWRFNMRQNCMAGVGELCVEQVIV